MKKCSSCKDYYDESQFHRNKSRKDGLSETCKKCACERSKKWQIENRERAIERNKQWVKNNAERNKNNFKRWYASIGKQSIIDRAKKWKIDNPDKSKESARKSSAERRKNPKVKEKQRLDNLAKKMRIINYYSGGDNACACCKESHIEFLTIDHINGGGHKHRKEVNVYSWIIRNNFPEGFRILCMNCNFAFGRFGYCPHNNISS